MVCWFYTNEILRKYLNMFIIIGMMVETSIEVSVVGLVCIVLLVVMNTVNTI